MEADGAAAINDAVEEVRRRSLRERGWTIKQATEDMRSGKWERRRRLYRTLQANAGLAEVDPWDLPPRFAMPKEPGSSSLRTQSGYWKEKEDEFKAIRSDGGGGEGSSSASSSSPSYQGLRRTLEFYEHNGTNTDWVIHEYNLIDDHLTLTVKTLEYSRRLQLHDDIVYRKVFKKTHTDIAKLGTFHPLIICHYIPL